MRPFSIAMILLGLLLTTSSGFAQEVMTNQTVVEMVKAGLSERVIVAKIRTSPTNFDVRTDALIALKKNGAGEGHRSHSLAVGSVGFRRVFAVRRSSLGKRRGRPAGDEPGTHAADSLPDHRR